MAIMISIDTDAPDRAAELDIRQTAIDALAAVGFRVSMLADGTAHMVAPGCQTIGDRMADASIPLEVANRHEYERPEGYPANYACRVCGFNDRHPWHGSESEGWV